MWIDNNNNNYLEPGIDKYWDPKNVCPGAPNVISGGTYDIWQRGGGENRYYSWSCVNQIPRYMGVNTADGWDIITRTAGILPDGVEPCAAGRTYWNGGGGSPGIYTCYYFWYSWANYVGQTNIRFVGTLPPSTPRTVTGSIYETTNPGSCTNNAVIALSGLNAAIYNGATSVASGGVNSSNGSYSISTISTDTFDSLCINGNLSSATSAYQLACVTTNPGSPTYTCQRGSGACAITCTPSTILSTNSPVINLGFDKVDNAKWTSTLDGDIYGSSILEYVAQTPLGGFTDNIINTYSGTTVGGYGFAGTTINTQTSGSAVSERGGHGQGLNRGPITFEDNWLNKFSFTAPQIVTSTPPAGNAFSEGTIYRLTTAQFNTLLTSGTYRIARTFPQPSGASIVYVLGGGTININNNFINTGTNRESLVVVTDANVEIADTVSLATTSTLNLDSTSQVDLSLLTSGTITIRSRYNAGTNTVDKPIMLNGTLIARGTVHPNRNLGGLDNSRFPADTVRFYPYLMETIKRYELANPTRVSFTGLSTYDVQFNY